MPDLVDQHSLPETMDLLESLRKIRGARAQAPRRDDVIRDMTPAQMRSVAARFGRA